MNKIMCHVHYSHLTLRKVLLANNVDSDQISHYVASDLGLQCLPMTLCKDRLKIYSFVGNIKMIW